MSLPARPGYEGIGPSRLRVHGGPVLAELHSRFGADAAAKVLAGEVVCADGSVVTEVTELPAGAFIYWYRDLPDEVVVPFDMPVLYRDENIVVVDKPHFLATMPAADMWCRRPWCGCGGPWGCGSSRRPTGWTG